jgi:hypothetical protein
LQGCIIGEGRSAGEGTGSRHAIVFWRMNAIRFVVIALGLLLVACTPGGASSSPPTSAEPTPTPIADPVASVEEAAAIVIASDTRFSGVTRYDPNLIGASAWWEGESSPAGFSITITIGWGDCPAGCISKHVWNFTVTPAGELTLDSESGDPLPPGDLPG